MRLYNCYLTSKKSSWTAYCSFSWRLMGWLLTLGASESAFTNEWQDWSRFVVLMYVFHWAVVWGEIIVVKTEWDFMRRLEVVLVGFKIRWSVWCDVIVVDLCSQIVWLSYGNSVCFFPRKWTLRRLLICRLAGYSVGANSKNINIVFQLFS